MELIVLDRAVLTVAMGMRNDLLCEKQEDDHNRAFRHKACRQFVMWRSGRLRIGDRRVIPSCVVTRVRNVFPNPRGQYTGFKVSA